MVDLDSETLFNAAAAALTTAAVLVFVFNVDLGFSPVTTVAIAVAFLAGVVVITQRTDDRQLTFLGYGVVVASTVAVFVDLVNTLDLGSGVTVLGLLGIAAALFGLRARLDDANRLVAPRTATYLFGALAVRVLGLLDAIEAQPRFEDVLPGLVLGGEQQVIEDAQVSDLSRDLERPHHPRPRSRPHHRGRRSCRRRRRRLSCRLPHHP